MNMLTRLYAENILSLKCVDIELGKVNVFVGPNASGKSNIVRALQLLANHARSGLPVLDGYKELKSLSFSFNPVVGMFLSLEALIERTKHAFLLELTNEFYVEKIAVADKIIVEHKGNEPHVKIKDQTRSPFPPSAYRSSAYYGRPTHLSVLSFLPSDVDLTVHRMASSLKSIFTYSFAPDRIRSRNPVSEKPLLKYHGENLARHLLYLYTEKRKSFRRVEEALCGMIPETEEIIPHIEGSEVEIWIKIKGLEEPLKLSNISDGTLRLLAIITALYGGSSLVALEEPENCIHPRLLETLMWLARDSPSQVIITTHSPYLLDHVKPEEVYVVEKEGLETRVKKLSTSKEVEAVKKFLEEGGTLGEAWYSGLMGGVS